MNSIQKLEIANLKKLEDYITQYEVKDLNDNVIHSLLIELYQITAMKIAIHSSLGAEMLVPTDSGTGVKANPLIAKILDIDAKIIQFTKAITNALATEGEGTDELTTFLRG